MWKQGLETHWLFAALAQLTLRAPDGLGQAGGWSCSEEKDKNDSWGSGEVKGCAHHEGSSLDPSVLLPWASLAPLRLSKSRDGSPRCPPQCSATRLPWPFFKKSTFPSLKPSWVPSFLITKSPLVPLVPSKHWCLGCHRLQVQGAPCYHLNIPYNMRIYRCSTYLHLICLMCA